MSEQFFIVSMARSGTNYLRSWINAKSTHFCLNEIFRPQGDSFREISKMCGLDRKSIERYAREDKAGLWNLITAETDDNSLSLGAKLFYYHANTHDPLWDIVDSSRVVHLIRANPLAVYVSAKLAHASGIWRTSRYSKRYDAREVTIDREHFESWYQMRAEWIQWARDRFAGPRYHELYYEDIVEVPDPSARIATAMGAEHPWPAPREEITRQRRRPLEQIVENYSEMADYDTDAYG